MKAMVFYYFGDVPMIEIVCNYYGEDPVMTMVLHYFGDVPLMVMICNYYGEEPVMAMVLHFFGDAPVMGIACNYYGGWGSYFGFLQPFPWGSTNFLQREFSINALCL